MEQPAVDLKREQQAARARPPYPYSAFARIMFRSMDALTGPEDTLAKARLIEALAPFPYRAWENRLQASMALRYADQELVARGRRIVDWARDAQDNEYRHLRIVDEKLREDGVPDPRYMSRPVPYLLVTGYAAMLWVLSRVGLRWGFLLNAELEDHSEHVYAKLVDDHPEWEDQPVTSPLVQEYGSFDSWADVFRRVGLDERDHMNASFAFGGKPGRVVEYEGMPDRHSEAGSMAA